MWNISFEIPVDMFNTRVFTIQCENYFNERKNIYMYLFTTCVNQRMALSKKGKKTQNIIHTLNSNVMIIILRNYIK